MQPLLEIFTTSWNEHRTVEKLINWYRDRVPDCAITVFDNESSDYGSTRRICEIYEARFMTFSTDGKMAEEVLIQLRNTAWKSTAAKFAIVCDSDELVDISESQLLSCGDGEKWNLCKCHGVELFGHDADLCGEFWGIDSEGYSKSVLFYAPAVDSMNFFAGSHSCSPAMNPGYEQKWCEEKINLYHTKWQSWEKGLVRQNEIKNKGISQFSQDRKWNFHYSLPDSAHEEYFRNGYEKRRRFL